MKDIVFQEIMDSDDLYETIKNIILKVGEYNQGIVIFGCSTIGKVCLKALQSLSLEPICFCDDYLASSLQSYNDIPIIKSQELYSKYDKPYIILAINVQDHLENVRAQMLSQKEYHFIDKELFLYFQKFSETATQNTIMSSNKNQDAYNITFNKVNLNITSRCTLNCLGCGELVPYTKILGDSSLNIIKKSIDGICESVDFIAVLEIMGGEPLLHPDLCEVIKYAAQKPNVLCITIDTNGTIIPTNKLLETMKAFSIAMRVTDYGKHSMEKHNIAKLCRDVGVTFTVQKPFDWWYQSDFNLSQQQNNDEKFQRCKAAFSCSSLFDGKWHICARDAKLTKLGIISENEGEYINFQDNIAILENRKKMHTLLNRQRSIKSCKFCDGTDVKIEGGIQY